MTKLIHAIERAIERVGVALSLDDLRGMAKKIEDGGAFRLTDRRGGMRQYVVTWKGSSFRVVYNPDQQRILTVLDPIGAPRKRGRK